jgi:hypothetical protein
VIRVRPRGFGWRKVDPMKSFPGINKQRPTTGNLFSIIAGYT